MKNPNDYQITNLTEDELDIIWMALRAYEREVAPSERAVVNALRTEKVWPAKRAAERAETIASERAHGERS